MEQAIEHYEPALQEDYSEIVHWKPSGAQRLMIYEGYWNDKGEEYWKKKGYTGLMTTKHLENALRTVTRVEDSLKTCPSTGVTNGTTIKILKRELEKRAEALRDHEIKSREVVPEIEFLSSTESGIGDPSTPIHELGKTASMYKRDLPRKPWPDATSKPLEMPVVPQEKTGKKRGPKPGASKMNRPVSLECKLDDALLLSATADCSISEEIFAFVLNLQKRGAIDEFSYKEHRK